MSIFRRPHKFLSQITGQSLKINVLSNFIGNVWGALISLILVPINLHYLGIEAYGIIGIFNSLQSFVWLFDLGLSDVISRELPHIAAQPHKTQEILDLTRTTERINWLMGIVISIFLIAVAPLVAGYWLQIGEMPESTVSQALAIMSAGFITQWTLSFYNTGLAALQKQSLLNSINVVFNTIRSGGGVLVLIFISPTIQAFLIWQVIIGIFQLLMLGWTFHKCLPPSPSVVRFRWHLLKSRMGFASGITIISILGLVLHQLDKIILSRLLTLEFFGYYTLATTVTSLGLGLIPRSVINAVYPRFSYFISLNDQENLRSLFHRSSQVIAVLMLPAAAILIVFPYKILYLWTQNATTANNTGTLLAILAVATAVNGFLNVPYYIQLAHGWTKIIIVTAIITLFTITPIMILTVARYGAVAGALNWLALNVFQILVSVPVMHRYTLIGEQWKWYFVDILKPFALALIIAFVCKMLFDPSDSKIVIFTTLAVTAVVSYTCVALTTEFTRNWMFGMYDKYFGNKLLT